MFAAADRRVEVLSGDQLFKLHNLRIPPNVQVIIPDRFKQALLSFPESPGLRLIILTFQQPPQLGVDNGGDDQE